MVEKGENAGNQHFLLFLQCFLSYKKKNFFNLTHIPFLFENPLGFFKAKTLLFKLTVFDVSLPDNNIISDGIPKKNLHIANKLKLK